MTQHESRNEDLGTETEEWFLEQLGKRPMDGHRILTTLRHTASRGGTRQAEERARLLEETLAANGELAAAMEVLEARAAWIEPAGSARSVLAKAVEGLLAASVEQRELIRDAGFDRPLPPAECVRRLRVLLALVPGALCYETGWGFGVVRSADPFAHRVEIDFESRSGHGMALTYAAEKVRVLEPGHFLARFHKQPDSIRELARQRPGELVALVLESFGPMPVAELQSQIVPRVLDAAAWKPFWEAARKALKKDGCVIFPARRNDPLTFRAAGTADFDASWFAQLAGNRDMRSILDQAQRLLDAGRAGALDPEFARILDERLAFVLRGAEPRHWDLWVRSLLLTSASGIGAERIAAGLRRFEHSDFLLKALDHMAQRDFEPLFAFLHDRAGDRFREQIKEVLPRLEIGPLTVAVTLLSNTGEEAICASTLKDLFGKQTASVHVLLWAFRNPDKMGPWNLVSPGDLARMTLTALEQEAGGSELRSQNQIRERFEQPDWLQKMVEDMNPSQRKEFIERLKTTSAWSSLDRQAILGRIIKRFPELERFMAAAASSSETSRKGPLTSARSYRARQAALEKIVREEIPANSREIGHARSYGDLRENFEYKAAKDMQTVLLRRRGELERMLKEVQPSEFEGLPFDRAGLATGVDLEYGDGRTERLYILGVWDRDESLGIISSDTELARAVIGKKPGDPFEVRAGDTAQCGRVRAVVPLPDSIRHWILGDGTTGVN